jgi:hypothetical protein
MKQKKYRIFLSIVTDSPKILNKAPMSPLILLVALASEKTHRRNIRLYVLGLLLLPWKEPREPIPRLPREDADKFEADNDNARTPPDPEDEGRGPNTSLLDLLSKPSLLPQ